MKLKFVIREVKKDLLERLKEISPDVSGITITPEEIRIESKVELSADIKEEVKRVLREEYGLAIE